MEKDVFPTRIRRLSNFHSLLLPVGTLLPGQVLREIIFYQGISPDNRCCLSFRKIEASGYDPDVRSQTRILFLIEEPVQG